MNMKKQILFVVLVAVSSVLYAAKTTGKDETYPVNAIPAELRENVNAVIREDHTVLRISSEKECVTYIRKVVTILNANAKYYADETVGYSKLTKVNFFKGVVYDADGNVIKKLKSSEIRDYSAYDGFTLFSDQRIKYADLSQGNYPYTVEFEYEVEDRYLYAMDGLSLLYDEKASVQNASYQIIFNPAVAPRYKTFNITSDPEKSDVNGMKSLKWNFKNLKPIEREAFGPDYFKILPTIKVAPGKFEYDGYAGDMTTWEGYAKWESSLLVGRNELSEATKQKLKSLTAPLKTTEEKVKVIYEYLQNRTRYVNIALGIGGLQPFKASLVDEVGYGDCKALSNYMVSMLGEVGIRGHYTTVFAGNSWNDPVLDFPSHYGNHVVVAVPNGADTLWLECTSQTKPFGYAGRFTGDRKAFMLTDKGGVWANTPKYTAEHNLQSRSAEVSIEATGDATAKVKTTYSGVQYENDDLDNILNSQGEDQKKWLRTNTGIPVFDITSFKMTNIKNKIPSAIIDANYSLRKFASVSGKRIFLTPNLMNRLSYIPEKLEKRKSPIVFKIPMTDVDTIHYKLPDGIYPEFLPEPVVIKSRFGEYEAKYVVDEKGLTYIRRMKLNKGTFPAESYNEMVDFYRGINKADNSKLVFVNKT
jgi:hypothetical protein